MMNLIIIYSGASLNKTADQSPRTVTLNFLRFACKQYRPPFKGGAVAHKIHANTISFEMNNRSVRGNE